MVAAIAFESVVKLFAFLAVGSTSLTGSYDGLATSTRERCRPCPSCGGACSPSTVPAGSPTGLVPHVLLSMLSMIFCRGSSRSTVVENVATSSTCAARPGCSPPTCSLINIFVIPIAIGGLMHFRPRHRGSGHLRADPAARARAGWLRALVFIGGLSAATGMVIVEAIALSTMVCNDLVMPLLLRYRSTSRASRRGSVRPAAGHPPRCDRGAAAARLPLLPPAGEAMRW